LKRPSYSKPTAPPVLIFGVDGEDKSFFENGDKSLLYGTAPLPKKKKVKLLTSEKPSNIIMYIIMQ
jgi:hypothetical protein